MTKINYKLPIVHNDSKASSFLNEFFNYNGRHYKVIQIENGHLNLQEDIASHSSLKRVIKVVLIFTIFLPLIAGVYKLVQIIKWSFYKKVTIITYNSVKVDLINKGSKALNDLKLSEKNLEKFLRENGTEIRLLKLHSCAQEKVLNYLHYCPNVETLVLDGNLMQAEGLNKIATLSLVHLKKLSIMTNLMLDTYLKADDLKSLLESENLKNVTRLNLGDVFLDQKGASYIAHSPYLRNMEEILLDRCGLDDEAMKILAQSENFKKLQNLSLENNDLKEEGAKVIANGVNFSELQNLYLRGNKIGTKGANAFSTSSTLTKLKKLDIRFNYLNNFEIEEVKRMFSKKEIEMFA